MLSMYFYLKQNNYHKTAESLYSELKLDKVFDFPDLKQNDEALSISEEFKRTFFSSLISRQDDENSDKTDDNYQISFLNQNWNLFWNFFINKIDNGSFSSPMDEELGNSTMKLTYNYDCINKKQNES